MGAHLIKKYLVLPALASSTIQLLPISFIIAQASPKGKTALTLRTQGILMST